MQRIPPQRRKSKGHPCLLAQAMLRFALIIEFVLVSYLARASDTLSKEVTLGPYTGPTRSDIDATTLDGKVLCGYQGWFNTPCDSEPFGFSHWGQGLEDGR